MKGLNNWSILPVIVVVVMSRTPEDDPQKR